MRVHNLKNLDIDIPLNQLVVITGVSGSGKSSLAFDTLFLEGQRQYIESFSTSERRHLERIERPNADRMSHIPVAIAVQNDRGRKQRLTDRSTVAMLADAVDGLKQLFARIGRIVCPRCRVTVKANSARDIVQSIAGLPDGTRCQLIFVASNEPDARANWLKKGFGRAIWDGQTHDLSSTSNGPAVADLWLIADRLVAGKTSPERIAESAETAFAQGNGRCQLLIEAKSNADKTAIRIDGRDWNVVGFSRHWECSECHRAFLPLEPRLFSHVQSGACPTCRGTGRASVEQNQEIPCESCGGTRLREEARVVLIDDQSIADILHLCPAKSMEFVIGLGDRLNPDELKLTELIRRDLIARLAIMRDLGFDYLTLDRSANSLSSAESRRLKLASLLGARITGTLIVIDEPSDGLTAAEIPNVLRSLRQLQSNRNSVVVVDHSPLVMAAADHVVELGPGAGPAGGTVVFQGSLNLESLGTEFTTSSVNHASKIRADKFLRLDQIEHHNFHGARFQFPLNQLCVVTGPSGSGKTSLITQVLYPALCQRLNRPVDVPIVGLCQLADGNEISDVVLIDQSPLSKSSRSNPATWLDLFDEIRQIFATTTDARQRGFTAREFSFNSSSGGRCRGCQGSGILKQSMQFLPDMTLPCLECGGSRYRKEILEVKYRGRSIADVLQMSVSEAAGFFRSQPRIQSRFQMLKQMGLDYLVLGQPSETLSGGEAQRLKLAARMMTPNASPGLILCDDPTTGLHPKDVRQLVVCFRELISNGHSLILADTSPDLISAADSVIELDSFRSIPWDNARTS